MTPVLASGAVTVADRIASALNNPGSVLPEGHRSDNGRRWPQSLAGGAAGIALLHVERARTGHGDWETARTWLAEAASGSISAASNAGLFFGAPALALLFHIAASSTGRYGRTLAALDDATVNLTRQSIFDAHVRMGRGDRPALREFDLIRGLAGLAAYHLAARPEHEVTRSVLACLARLTEPLPGAAGMLPPWWTNVSPTGRPSPDYPGGHGNVGMSHGISAVLAVLSIAILRGIAVPRVDEAARRICTWTDQWKQGSQTRPWWPSIITAGQVRARHVDPGLRPRPSWCYGTAGTARAQQLAALALRDPERQRAAEAAILAVLRDPAELAMLPDIGLCHGTAGLLQAAWRMSTDAATCEVSDQIPGVAARLTSQLAGLGDNPELLDGTAGAALALHTAGTGTASEPCWDAFLALA